MYSYIVGLDIVDVFFHIANPHVLFELNSSEWL